MFAAELYESAAAYGVPSAPVVLEYQPSNV